MIGLEVAAMDASNRLTTSASAAKDCTVWIAARHSVAKRVDEPKIFSVKTVFLCVVFNLPIPKARVTGMVAIVTLRAIQRRISEA